MPPYPVSNRLSEEATALRQRALALRSQVRSAALLARLDTALAELDEIPGTFEHDFYALEALSVPRQRLELVETLMATYGHSAAVIPDEALSGLVDPARFEPPAPPLEGDARLCHHAGCTGTQTFSNQGRPPGAGKTVAADVAADAARSDARAGWFCDVDTSHVDPAEPTTASRA